jgi:outer membrane lipoprotein SlyB
MALGIAALSFTTSSVQAKATRSSNAIPTVIQKPPDDFTWNEFGQSAIGWAAGGAAGGAVECALVGTPVGVACGAAVGGLAGAVAGACAYLGSQAYNALFGVQGLPTALPASSLD